jgi:hypothetical protein
MDVFLEVIKTVGFPIACCIFLGWYLKTQTDQYRADVQAITEKYEKAIDKFSKSIDKNTLVLTSLENKLGIKEGEANERKL